MTAEITETKADTFAFPNAGIKFNATNRNPELIPYTIQYKLLNPTQSKYFSP